MNLTQINVRVAYTRSINVERDVSSKSVLEVYIPTNRALDTVRRIAQTLNPLRAVPRSWALIGPYGSGKSAFALYLSHVLGGSSDPLHRTAIKRLKAYDAALATTLPKKIGEGYVCLLLTGSPEAMSKRLLTALSEKIDALDDFSPEARLDLLARAEELRQQEHPSHSAVLQLLQEFQNNIALASGRNVMLVIDELGKFLEHEARSTKANDIHLLQTLAEHAAAARESCLQVLVLLHQSFDIYAKGVKASVKNEWLKVQGRFESISFIETAEQTIRLVSAAIVSDLPQAYSEQVSQQATSFAEVLAKAGALPPTLGVEEAAKLFYTCYPIHPVALLALPFLCQKVAQNERTLFTYLGSREPYGFQHTVERVLQEATPSWISPAGLYDYFVENQSLSLADPLTQRRWIEISTAVDRLVDGSHEQVALLKSVGILNLINAQAGFKASPEVLGTLHTCLEFRGQADVARTASISAIADELLNRSLIVFRKFTGEFRVWEGSDFDLESALKLQLAEHAGVRLSVRLKDHRKAAPIVARRFTIQTGNLRDFGRRFIELDELASEPVGLVPEILYVLVDPSADLEAAGATIVARSTTDILRLITLIPVSADLLGLVSEAEALRVIEAKSPQLASDPIAMRELRERIRQAKAQEDAQLSYLIEEPESLQWFWRGKQFEIADRRQFQIKLSTLLAEDVFPETPYIRNELINRKRPSSMAMAARRKLVMAMLENHHRKDLGIEKFPAEKAMYLSILHSTGIHREVEGSWQFCDPDFEKSETKTYRAVWNAMHDYFESSRKQPKSVAGLFQILVQKPYGVKEGVLPVLWLAAYLAHQDEIAIFDGETFVPTLTQEGLEKILNNPTAIFVQSTSLKGIRSTLLSKYGEALALGTTGPKSLLVTVRPIAKLLMGLPDFTKKTKRVSLQAQSVRTLFLKAKSPGELLFQLLPRACGFDGDQLDDLESIERYTSTLTAALQELKVAYPSLMREFEGKLRAVFDYKKIETLEKLRETLRGQVQGLDALTIDTDGLKAFILCIKDESGDAHQWLERVASFLAKKPADKWGDTDLAMAEVRLIDLVRKVLELQKLKVEFHGNALGNTADFEVLLVRTVRPQAKGFEKLVRIDREKRQILDDLKKKVLTVLDAEPDEQVKLALMGELLENLLEPQPAHLVSYQDERIRSK